MELGPVKRPAGVAMGIDVDEADGAVAADGSQVLFEILSLMVFSPFVNGTRG